MGDAPSVNYDVGESQDQPSNDSETDTCDVCGAELEWTLDVNGIQRKECPCCDDSV